MKRVSKAVLAAMGLMMLSGSAFANDMPSAYNTFFIRLEPNPVQSDVKAILKAPENKENVSFRIENNTGKAVYFINGEEKTYIPVVSHAVVTVPSEPKPYSVQDIEGNTIASWKVVDAEPITANVTSATGAQFQQWGSQLQEVIKSAQNRSVAYSYQKSESGYTSTPATSPAPQYNEPAPSTRGTMIRGYW